MDAVEIMRKTKSFAIIGASAKEDSYGYKLVKNLTDVGYKVYPINPKYPEIYEIKTYQGLGELPDTPDNIVFAMSPYNNLKSFENLNIEKTTYIWFPPECWNDELIAKAKEMNIQVLQDVCPIGTYLKLFNSKKEI